jgi:hypothetical protein
MKTAVAAIALLSLSADIAHSDLLYPSALTFAPAYASGPFAGFPWGTIPDFGDPITIVGTVENVAAPFVDLLPPGSYEITLVYEGATCFQAGNFDGPCSGGEFGAFQGGTLSFYLDSTPDADFSNSSTFRDGELVLLAQMSDLYVGDDDPYAACPWMPDERDVFGGCAFTGGTWFSRVQTQGVGLEGSFESEINYPGNVPVPLQALGYIFRADGHIDIHGPVPVEPTTWGRVKSLYR